MQPSSLLCLFAGAAVSLPVVVVAVTVGVAASRAVVSVAVLVRFLQQFPPKPELPR